MIVISSMDRLPSSCYACPCFNPRIERCNMIVDDSPFINPVDRRKPGCPLKYIDETPVMQPNDISPTTATAAASNIVTSVASNIFDSVEEHHNCFVQIFRNSVTGEASFGWRKEKDDGE